MKFSCGLVTIRWREDKENVQIGGWGQWLVLANSFQGSTKALEDEKLYSKLILVDQAWGPLCLAVKILCEHIGFHKWPNSGFQSENNEHYHLWIKIDTSTNTHACAHTHVPMCTHTQSHHAFWIKDAKHLWKHLHLLWSNFSSRIIWIWPYSLWTFCFYTGLI